jgi:hypothetical protein
MTFGVDELLNALEPLLQRVVRESEIVKNNTFYIEANSPLYKDIGRNYPT